VSLNRTVSSEEIEQWKYTYLLFADEISFADKSKVQNLHTKLCQIKENPHAKFGGIPIVFAGDFTQLQPVGGRTLYLFNNFEPWWGWVHTFLDLKKNHRFLADKPWGDLLTRFRDFGPTVEDVEKINTRVVGSHNGPTEADIAIGKTYATKMNKDRMAINDAIFANHLKHTHSKEANVPPPRHTICVMASNMKLKKSGTYNTYYDMNERCKDVIYEMCGEHFIQRTNGKHKNYDPLVKMYNGRPMINQNEDVKNAVANCAMCEFQGIDLKQWVIFSDLKKIVIDGYYVWAANVSQIESLHVKILDGPKDKIISLVPITKTME
jgi:hypothetical protein